MTHGVRGFAGINQSSLQRNCRLLFLFALALFVLLWADDADCATVPAGFADIDVSGYWEGIAGIVFDATGRLYAWERTGRIWIFENDVKLATPLIDISDEVGGWDDLGLLGVALHPNFSQNGYIYLFYTVDHHHLAYYGTPNYNVNSNEYHQATIGRLTRYTARVSDNFHSVDPASRKVLIGESASTGIPIVFNTHGPDSLVFGTDGTLLAACGEGAHVSDDGSNPVTYYQQALNEGIIRPAENVGAFRAQMVNSLSGKILRIDPDTGNGIPSNPFYDPSNPRAPRSRVWALGIRQPFRIALRPGTGSHNPADGNPGVLYFGDVGHDTWEELSVVTGPGRNFGWPIFEGLEASPDYLDRNPTNQDTPNPLFGSGGCTQQYFTFRDLLVQETLATPSWPNPCAPGQQIPASTPHFMHTRPALDWKHSTGPSRTGIFNGTQATVINIGATGSPVSGPQFAGNCSIGGLWYQGDNFPASYKNTYFHGDLGEQWIRNITFDVNNKPVSVRDFASATEGLVCMAEHPIDGTLYYLDFYGGLRKIAFAGNRPPIAVATANKSYGPTPLAVQFNGSGSTDPEAGPLTYSWNFGDGSATSTVANPSHTFTAPAGVPTEFVVTLTVKDNANATNMVTLILSLNNTPPSATITNPVQGTRYSMTQDTPLNLRATVTDAEQSDAQIAYQWQTILHHNNHEHPQPVDTNHVTSTVLSPIGCDGNLYYYRIVLIVTDAAGLSATNEVDLYPACTNRAPIASFTATPTNGNPPLLVAFDARASSDPDGDPLGYNWNFGDNTTGVGAIPTHTYSAGGTYTASLVVTDTFGLAATSTVRIGVSAGPIISPIADQTIVRSTTTAPISFTLSDPAKPTATLSVSAASSNPALVPNTNLVFGGSGTNRTVAITPLTNQTGTATITISVNDGSASASRAFLLTVVPSPARFAVKVNFQPGSAPVPAGYLMDDGSFYADRGGGQFYGWDGLNISPARDRDSPLSPDQRFDTFNSMQAVGSRLWEIGVSNGTYTVLVVAGDPTAFDSVYKINVEGLLTVNGTPSSSNRWIWGTSTVTVNDGRLTVSNGAGATNNKICFIDITSGPVASGAQLPPRLTLLQRDTNGWVYISLQGQAGRNYVLEASTDFLNWHPVTLLQHIGSSVTFIDKNVASSSQCFYRASTAR